MASCCAWTLWHRPVRRVQGRQGGEWTKLEVEAKGAGFWGCGRGGGALGGGWMQRLVVIAGNEQRKRSRDRVCIR